MKQTPKLRIIPNFRQTTPEEQKKLDEELIKTFKEATDNTNTIQQTKLVKLNPSQELDVALSEFMDAFYEDNTAKLRKV